MKWKSSAHFDDVVTLTWLDLVKLAFGRVLQDSACMVKKGSPPFGVHTLTRRSGSMGVRECEYDTCPDQR